MKFNKSNVFSAIIVSLLSLLSLIIVVLLLNQDVLFDNNTTYFNQENNQTSETINDNLSNDSIIGTLNLENINDTYTLIEVSNRHGILTEENTLAVSSNYADENDLNIGDSFKYGNVIYKIETIYTRDVNMQANLFIYKTENLIPNFIVSKDLDLDGWSPISNSGSNQEETYFKLIILILNFLLFAVVISYFTVITFSINKRLYLRRSHITIYRTLGFSNINIAFRELQKYMLLKFSLSVIVSIIMLYLVKPILVLQLTSYTGIDQEALISETINVSNLLFIIFFYCLVECMIFLRRINKESLKKSISNNKVSGKNYNLKKKNIIFLLLISILILISYIFEQNLLVAILIIIASYSLAQLLPYFILSIIKLSKTDKLIISKSLIRNNLNLSGKIFNGIVTANVFLLIALTTTIGSVQSITDSFDIFLTQGAIIDNRLTDSISYTDIEGINSITTYEEVLSLYPTYPVKANSKSIEGYQIKSFPNSITASCFEGELAEDEVVLGEAIYKVLNVDIGDEITIDNNTYKISGTTCSSENGSQIIYMSNSLIEDNFQNYNEVFDVKYDDEDLLRSQINSRSEYLSMTTTSEYKEIYKNSIIQTLSPIITILLFVVLIMFMQVILFLLTLIRNSSKTYVLLKTMGETGKDIFKETLVLLIGITTICYIYAMLFVYIFSFYLEDFFINSLGSNIKIDLFNLELHVAIILILVLIDFTFALYVPSYIKKIKIREIN